MTRSLVTLTQLLSLLEGASSGEAGVLTPAAAGGGASQSPTFSPSANSHQAFNHPVHDGWPHHFSNRYKGAFVGLARGFEPRAAGTIRHR